MVRRGDAQKDVAAEDRDEIAGRITPAQIGEAQRLSQQCQARQFKGCSVGSVEVLPPPQPPRHPSL